MNEEERPSFKRLDRCRTRKCSKNIKLRNSEAAKFHKEEAKKCRQKSPKAFSDCSSSLYEKSKYKNLAKAAVKCSDKMCAKEHRYLRRTRNKEYRAWDQLHKCRTRKCHLATNRGVLECSKKKCAREERHHNQLSKL